MKTISTQTPPPLPAEQGQKKAQFAFTRTNFILLAVGMAIVILGFILMAGGGTTEEGFNPDIFSARRIKVAPVVCLFGYLFMVYAILKKAKSPKED
ncbi:MAG: DUF3098 domain-containing protein [Alloprevotella sp.]|nr:DUF3098 domain-containing protein [Bacteroidales bacterium]MDY2624430.1 DUF3098 domain-containing protein [Alloprevotella sp.]MDY6113227.1 DUF3098 domain-containing protein [Alloprevotella sp.]